MPRLRLILAFAALTAAPALAQFGPSPGADLGPSGAERDILPDRAPPQTDAIVNRELGLRRNFNLDEAPSAYQPRPFREGGRTGLRDPFLHSDCLRDPFCDERG